MRRTGPAISPHPHLPLALDYRDRASVAVLDDATLIRLAAECATWRAEMTEFQASLTTPSSRIVWRALCMLEVEAVIEAAERISTEQKLRVLDLALPTTLGDARMPA